MKFSFKLLRSTRGSHKPKTKQTIYGIRKRLQNIDRLLHKAVLYVFRTAMKCDFEGDDLQTKRRERKLFRGICAVVDAGKDCHQALEKKIQKNGKILKKVDSLRIVSKDEMDSAVYLQRNFGWNGRVVFPEEAGADLTNVLVEMANENDIRYSTV